MTTATEPALDWLAISALAARVGREIAAKWAVVHADDVQQEILLHMVEQADHIAARADDTTFLRKVAWKAGKSFCSREQRAHDLADDAYYYTPSEARAALRSMIYTDEEIGAQLGKPDDLTRCTITDSIISARVDAEAGLRRLTPRYREVLERVFIEGLPPRSDAERRTAYRAADALATAMNAHHRTNK